MTTQPNERPAQADQPPTAGPPKHTDKSPTACRGDGSGRPCDGRPARPRRHTRPCNREWRVERVETAPMTSEQYDDAVRLLAALFRQWLAKQRDDADPRRPE